MTGPGGCMTWEQCYACLTDQKLNSEIRAIYVRLIYDLFINVGCNFVTIEPRLVFSYPDLPKPCKLPLKGGRVSVCNSTFRVPSLASLSPILLLKSSLCSFEEKAAGRSPADVSTEGQ